MAHAQCRGCAYQLGLTRHGECAIFQCCVAERGLEHCGLCPDFPCDVFRDSLPADELECRVRALRQRAAKGTDEWLAEGQG